MERSLRKWRRGVLGLSVSILVLLMSCVAEGQERAPDFDSGYGWYNTDKPLHVTDLKGKFILLDFWTYGCVNCYHVLPEIERLERRFPKSLVVIGVHSGKFTSERDGDRIRKAIAKFGIHHPVVNDKNFDVWKRYGVQAWPTAVLISPTGYVIAQYAGEGVYQAMEPVILKGEKKYAKDLNLTPMSFGKVKPEGGFLRFPGKIISDGEGGFWISDSGHNRLLQIDESGKVKRIVGSGKKGAHNDVFSLAEFNNPQGMALIGRKLYVADAGNNMIRVLDLKSETVNTASGTGALGYYWGGEKWGVSVLPNSPWDLASEGTNLYVADAGNHQILRFDLASSKLYRFAGSGNESLQDGTFRGAAFSQPSGICIQGEKIYVADAESSAVRTLDLKTKQVKTLVGEGLFDYGDRDGKFDKARLQHVSGIAVSSGTLWITDTYNNKVKSLHLKDATVTTVVDGLSEPHGVVFRDSILWITNTNAHEIIRFDISAGKKRKINVRP